MRECRWTDSPALSFFIKNRPFYFLHIYRTGILHNNLNRCNDERECFEESNEPVRCDR